MESNLTMVQKTVCMCTSRGRETWATEPEEGFHTISLEQRGLLLNSEHNYNLYICLSSLT